MIKTRNRRRALALAGLIFAAVLPNAGAAQIFKPLRCEAPPVIDGRLDDPAWRNAPSVSGFKTFIPDFSRDLSEETVAYMAYDSENLYFGFKCFDREPDKIKAAVANRDTIRPDDMVCINLDSFNDQQSLYAFYVNPLGIQMDSRFASGQEDFSVDLVWYSAGRIDPDGYSVELRVPFKSIRYAGREKVEMSIFFERRISRRSEHGSYPPLDPQRGFFFLTQMLPFELLDIKPSVLLEAIPAFTYHQKYARPAGDLSAEKPLRELSLTGKYGLTSQLILDATWNPDFSQVEADAGQVDVNLRYSLFFPEKRPFFLEGSEMFLLGGSGKGSPLVSAVHTRMIADPRAGFKLSGKVGRRDTIAAIFALDESPSLDAPAGVPKHAGFLILRYKRAFSDDSYLGAFYTGREYGDNANRVAGADGQIRLNKSSILGFHGFGSWTRSEGNPGGPAEGAALALSYSYDTRNLGLGLGIHHVSPDFTTKSGYLTRTGLTDVTATVGPKIYPKSKTFRKISPVAFGSLLKDQPSGLSESNGGLSASILLPGNTTFNLQGEYANEVFLDERFETSSWSATLSSQVTKQLSLRGQVRRGFSIRYTADPYQGSGTGASASFVFQPSDKLNWTASLTYSDFFRESDGGKDFDYTILRNRLTYQMNKYLFVRAVVEYNSFRKSLLTDFLASFTYIPGTVLQLGYGSIYNKLKWEDGLFREDGRFLEMNRGIFFKASYLWRL
jgi:hypothetical protein